MQSCLLFLQFYYPSSVLFNLSFSVLFSIPHDNLVFYFLAINCCITPSYIPYLCLYFCLSFAFLPVLEGQRERWQCFLLFKFYTSVVHWNIFSLNSIKHYLTNYSSLSLPHFLLAHEHSHFWLLRRNSRTYLSSALVLRHLAYRLQFHHKLPPFSVLSTGMSYQSGLAGPLL